MGARMLVVDDDNEEIDPLLLDEGYVSLIASSGEEAIRVAVIQQPDLVLVDLRMPLMDGYELAANLRELLVLQDTRIVAPSGSSREQQRLCAAGFDGYIPKPIDSQLFGEQIKGFLAAA